jgi:OmcA/MtrC family decaheme c-type cytochrome
MRRISLAVALIGAVAAAGCGGGAKPSSTANKGTAGVDFDVTVHFQGPGAVTSIPAGITCAPQAAPQVGSLCTGTFASGTNVVLTATADAGNFFNGWFGQCEGTGTCTLSGGADKYVVAYFSAEREFHANFNDGAVHGPAFNAQATNGLECYSCHGANGQGQGIAPSCITCHGTPFPLPDGAKVETCAGCHKQGAMAASLKHAQTGVVTATATTPVAAANGTDLEFTVNVKVDGVNSNAFSNTTGHSANRFALNSALATGVVLNPYERVTLTTTAPTAAVPPALPAHQYSIAAPVNGNYKVTIVGAAGLTGNQTFMVRLTDNGLPANRMYATVVTHFNGKARDLVGDAACVACHGNQVFRHRETSGEWHHGANPYGVEACVVCHTRASSVSRGQGGDRTMAYVHGIHNSHNMKAGTALGISGAVAHPEGVYFRNASGTSQFSIGFPSYMDNCANCHDTPARRTAIDARPVTFAACMSCHDSWAGFQHEPADHIATSPTTAAVAGTNVGGDCASCHSATGTAAKKKFSDFHNGLLTERAGIIWDGADQSVEQGKRIAVSISKISRSANNLVIEWGATVDGTAVNPCNATADVTATAPVFHLATANANGTAAHTWSVLRAFAQGNDWTNPGIGTSPGQPLSTNLSSSNTACVDNVATSTIALGATELATVAAGTKGAVSLQGKPQILFPGSGKVIYTRAKSPVREFVFATSDGELVQPTAILKRRQIVSVDKCNGCHQGSLYQHGGNRVDSIELCVMCHNPASTEKQVRVGMGVDASEAYDGKVGQTYDLRYMLHAIHSAGETGKLLVFYRSNGIYAWGNAASLAAIPNWESGTAATCELATPGSHGETSMAQYKVYGSTTSGTMPANDPATGKCYTTLPNSTDGTYKTHNAHAVHYPRALNDCSACHINGSENKFAEQATQMAVTEHDAGAVATATEIQNQLDDVLLGAGAASCMSCHQSSVAAEQTALRAHASSWGWTPVSFTGGRQELINWATCGAATCP